MTMLDPTRDSGRFVPEREQSGILGPLRRPWGLALLCTAAVLFSVSSLYFGASSASGPDTNWQVGMYLLGAAWAFLAATAVCGAFWAKPAPEGPRGDRVVLVIGGAAAATVAFADTVSTFAQANFWSDSSFNALQIVLALADLTIGTLILVLAALYGKHRVAPGGHVPLAPLLVAGIAYLGFVYEDIYGATWFDYTPVGNAVAAILVGVGFGGMGVALMLAALLKLGPGYRLLVAGAALVVVGVVEGVTTGVYLRSSVAAVLSIGEAAAFFIVAGVLLGSALLAPSHRASSASYPATPQWPHPDRASGVPVGDAVPAPPTPGWIPPDVPPTPPTPGWIPPDVPPTPPTPVS